MRFRRKKRFRSISPQVVDVDNLLKDTTRIERFAIFDVLSKFRRHLGVLLLSSGALSTILSIQFAAGSQMNLLSLIAMGFIGVANIFGGLLLLGSE